MRQGNAVLAFPPTHDLVGDTASSILEGFNARQASSPDRRTTADHGGIQQPHRHPKSFWGFSVGSRPQARLLYPQVLSYLRQVAAASDRVSIDELGESTLGNEMVAVVSDLRCEPAEPRPLSRDRWPAGQRRSADSSDEAALLIDEGKAIALVTCTIHSTEVGSTQMAMEFVHDFATTVDPEKLAWMEEMIVLLMPSINPDGQVMVVDWYNEHLGTEFEGGQMPWLYHHYVGHDNNRDFYMLTQKESRVVNQVLYHRWFPQVFLDEHQMGSTGPRMFVPPQTDPLASRDSLADLSPSRPHRHQHELPPRGGREAPGSATT